MLYLSYKTTNFTGFFALPPTLILSIIFVDINYYTNILLLQEILSITYRMSGKEPFVP